MQAPAPKGYLEGQPQPFVRRWNPRRVILATLAVITVIAGFYLIYRFSNVLFVLFIAIVLSTAMRPAVLWLERRHIPQWGGVLSIYLVVALIMAGVIAILVPLLIAQGTQIAHDVPGYYREARSSLRGANSQILRQVGNNLPQQLDLTVLVRRASNQAGGADGQPSVAVQLVGYLGAVASTIFAITAVALIAYFWTLEREKLVQAGLLIFPIDSRPSVREIWDTAELKVGAYMRGQALLMLTIAVLCAIAFFLIGLKSALILAVLAGLFEAIPYLGPILTAVVAVLVTLSESPDRIWWVLGALILIQQSENAILVPRIMDAAVGVNAIVTLLAIAAFGSLLGLVGAILAIPLAAIIQVLIDRWVLQRGIQPMAVIEGRGKVALVRYQAQVLAQDLRERIRAKPADEDIDDDSFEERIEALLGELDELLLQASTPAPPQATSAPGGRTI